jgi:hypothetical protein
VPELGYLFVMTYGRSGSTLLQGLLNAIPGYLIRGENGGALRGLHAFHRTCVTETTRRNPAVTASPTAPYFGINGFPAGLSSARLRDLVVETLLRPEPGTRVTGFKEIRWSSDDLAEYVGFLREVFPGARFVANTRNLEDTARSKWWADTPDAARILATAEERILAVAADLGPAAYHVHYDDYVGAPENLRGLYQWLGDDWDEEAVRATMVVRHSR